LSLPILFGLGRGQGEWKTLTCILFDFWYNIVNSERSQKMENPAHLPTDHRFTLYRDGEDIYTEETKKMSNSELLAAFKDLHEQWDDYGLCFDVESYDRELKAEKSRRGL